MYFFVRSKYAIEPRKEHFYFVFVEYRIQTRFRLILKATIPDDDFSVEYALTKT